MNDPRRARPASDGTWGRARRAYREILGEHDPAAAAVAAGALDLRPGYLPGEWDPARALVCSGPDDLLELRTIVEEAIGIGTWPVGSDADEARGDERRARVPVDRSASLLGLLLAMDGLIERRSPWGRWRTVVDTIADRVSSLDSLEVHVRIVGPAS